MLWCSWRGGGSAESPLEASLDAAAAPRSHDAPGAAQAPTEQRAPRDVTDGPGAAWVGSEPRGVGAVSAARWVP